MWVCIAREIFSVVSDSKHFFFHLHSYVREVFCPREGLAEDALKERLRLVDAAVGNIQVSTHCAVHTTIIWLGGVLLVPSSARRQHF